MTALPKLTKGCLFLLSAGMVGSRVHRAGWRLTVTHFEARSSQ